MRRIAVVLLVIGLVGALPGVAAADHSPPQIPFLPGQTTAQNQGGVEGVEFEVVESFITGNPHTDIDFFSRDGITYVSVGTLGIGPNNAGQNIFKLTDDSGAVTPETIEYVSGHPSATCITDESAALGLQHDVEATPKGQDVPILGNLTDNEDAVLGETQLLLDATDAKGRCHDNGQLGFQLPGGINDIPRGGLEIIDVSDPANPVEIGLTSHAGQAHTVNIDPKRPHIAYVVTSDAVGVAPDANDLDQDGDTEELLRQNEVAGSADQYDLDGFEVVDLSTCMTQPYGTMAEGLTTEQKRDACRPEVYRYRYPTLEMSLGHTNVNNVYGCHELEIWPEDEITCGSGAALIRFDIADAFDANGKPQGDPLPCNVRESTSTEPPGFAGLKTGAPITDCVVGQGDADLSIPGWLDAGAPSLEGVEYLGSAHHQGRQGNGEDVTDPAFPATEEIDFNHEAEYTHSRKFILATDERGGGITPPGASCGDEENLDNPVGNGGIHVYRVDQLFTNPNQAPEPEQADRSYALTPDGDKAIFRAPINTQPQATECTAHVFQQLPAGQDKTVGRIFMGWYTQGTQVVDYKENPDGTFEFAHMGYFIPEQANQWVSHVFASEPAGDGLTSYYGVAADFSVVNGRNEVLVYKATLPEVGATLNEDDDRDPDGDGDGNGGGGGDGGGDGGVGDVDDDVTLPATGGGFGLIPAGLGLLGAAAWLGRSRRNRDQDPPALD